MPRHKQPSDRALKAIALKAANPKMTDLEAATQAGYALSTARNAKRNIFDKPLVQTWLDNYRYTIQKAGLTQERVAGKLNELLEAPVTTIDSKGRIITDVITGKLQLETIKVYNEIFGVKDTGTNKSNEGVTRRLTIEEFEEKEGIA